ncbi:MAG: 50S ribosomal protein L9 [Cryomorphaceae bacterium]|nr:50S ribosomal protein L9 [Flavobacteriales bacterium]
MEIILKQDVEKLGFKDDLLEVKPGYARNFLIPNQLAVVATVSEKKIHAENLKQRAHKESKLKEEAEKLAKSLEEKTVKIGAKAGENGKIFGSVNTIQLADALTALGFEIDRKRITIKNEPIKQIGLYQADVMLHKGIVQTINFEVVGE